MAGLALGPNLLTGQKHPGAHAKRELHQPGRSRLCREGSQARRYGVFTSKNQPRVMRHTGSQRQVEGGRIQKQALSENAGIRRQLWEILSPRSRPLDTGQWFRQDLGSQSSGWRQSARKTKLQSLKHSASGRKGASDGAGLQG